jgi:pSer/pThr/pTyr-binding forkhead associated (FHA) protein
MSYPNSGPNPDDGNTPSLNFNSPQETGLAEILQMCCGNHRSGQITFRSGPSQGFVYIQHGRVLHALCGSVEGEEAVYLMLSWPGGGFSLDEDILPHKKTVSLTWEQLLFEGARRADSGPAEARNLPVRPTITIEPVTSSRVTDSQPKLTLNLPDQRPLIYQIEAEYTHVGRATGNEIPLEYPSVSNRHCIFILSGPDVILRDLNSSNGTIVNGETISEVILRPGDVIQVGVVQIKFEPAVRRPKLTQTSPTSSAEFGAGSELRAATAGRVPSRTTAKLPKRAPAAPPTPPPVINDDSEFVKGESAISYENLAKPEAPRKRHPLVLILVGLFLFLVILAGAFYYLVLHSHK